MVRQGDYREAEVQACFSVLLELMTVLGEFRENVVIVGEMSLHFLFRLPGRSTSVRWI